MRTRRMHFVPLAGGVVIAGVALFSKTGGSHPATPAASISGPALATPVVPAEPALPVKPAASAPALDVQLDKLVLVGDHYEAPLSDGRVARLTLDPALQAAAEKLLAEARAPRGAIVAMAPDGRILALAGRRSSDPKGVKDGAPDWHLATDAWAPSASVFKLVTASALVAGGVDPDEKIPFHGGLRSVVESNLQDDRRDNNTGSLAFGVAHSNNAILGKLAYEHLAPTALEGVARDLGLGFPLPDTLGLPGAVAELTLPHDKSLDFARAAAGFEGVRLSVMGGALLASAFADRGEQPVPRIIDSIAGSAPPASYPKARHAIAAEVARAVAKMMVETCESGSAAKSFRHHSVAVAGKTGTLTTTDPFYMEHSWFVGYAPADQPEIIVSVLLANSENWHLRGHEAAKRLIDVAIRPRVPAKNAAVR